MKETFEEIKKLLKKHKQEHLLTFWNRLNSKQRRKLLAQIQELDFSQIDIWAKKLIKKSRSFKIPSNITPAPYYKAIPTNSQEKRKYERAIKLGKNLISRGKVAAFVVAGGQGTRLGFKGPKGDFPISPIKKKTLFKIFAESIAAASRKYSVVCPWYIMTSPLNHKQTVEIFKKNRYYGLGRQNVFIFQQGTIVNFSRYGRIFLASKSEISRSPDGHGGSLKALYQSGALEDMKKRGVEYISYWQVDNPLVNIFDPLFLGLHVIDRAEMSSKAVIKAGPFEKIGNFCIHKGKVTVIEYSDMSKELATKHNRDGSLAFRLGSIAIHIINRKFVEKLNEHGFSLPLHKADKKISHIDRRGKLIEPKRKNGIKLESFVFDALPLASRSIILETVRNQEFAPTKNRRGVDSIETTRELMVTRAVDWLESAGIAVPKNLDGSPNCVVEIAPSFALYKEDIKKNLKRIPKIRLCSKVYLS